MEGKEIMNLTEEEKKAFKDYNERYLTDPLGGIYEAFIDSYYNPEDYPKFKEAGYSFVKRLQHDMQFPKCSVMPVQQPL